MPEVENFALPLGLAFSCGRVSAVQKENLESYTSSPINKEILSSDLTYF